MVKRSYNVVFADNEPWRKLREAVADYLEETGHTMWQYDVTISFRDPDGYIGLGDMTIFFEADDPTPPASASTA